MRAVHTTHPKHIPSPSARRQPHRRTSSKPKEARRLECGLKVLASEELPTSKDFAVNFMIRLSSAAVSPRLPFLGFGRRLSNSGPRGKAREGIARLPSGYGIRNSPVTVEFILERGFPAVDGRKVVRSINGAAAITVVSPAGTVKAVARASQVPSTEGCTMKPREDFRWSGLGFHGRERVARTNCLFHMSNRCLLNLVFGIFGGIGVFYLLNLIVPPIADGSTKSVKTVGGGFIREISVKERHPRILAQSDYDTALKQVCQFVAERCNRLRGVLVGNVHELGNPWVLGSSQKGITSSFSDDRPFLAESVARAESVAGSAVESSETIDCASRLLKNLPSHSRPLILKRTLTAAPTSNPSISSTLSRRS